MMYPGYNLLIPQRSMPINAMNTMASIACIVVSPIKAFFIINYFIVCSAGFLCTIHFIRIECGQMGQYHAALFIYIHYAH